MAFRSALLCLVCACSHATALKGPSSSSGGSSGGAVTGSGGAASTGNSSGSTGSSGGNSSSSSGGVVNNSIFPLLASPDARYLVDQSGTPFRIHGEASWDAHMNLGNSDLITYLDDRASKGITALFTYTTNPVAYAVGAVTPFAVQLGGPAAGTAALPFTKNDTGGAWDGDLTFSHHDADFSSPNDAYFEWVGQFVDLAAARGMVVLLCPMYLGYGLGAADGWYQTLINGVNTQTVMHDHGEYLANGHGVFSGFKNRPNIIWVNGGDTFPPNGSEGALRALAIVKGLQAAGDTHLQTAHWQHDYPTPEQSDFAPYLDAYSAYTHGNYPSNAPTYAEARVLYSEVTAHPTWLLETAYLGDHAASRADLRLFHWGAALSAIGGETMGFTPFWIFTTSPDGSSSNPISITTAWAASTSYTLNYYVSKGGHWYRATNSGESGASGPSGTGASIGDGTMTWAYAASGGWEALLNEAAIIDFTYLGTFMKGVAWYSLVPSALGGSKTLVTSGGGSYAAWSDQGFASGGMDWVVSAAASDGSLLVAYVPDSHSGAFSVDMSALSGSARARWLDPSSGTFTPDSTGLANTGTHSFTVPGSNSAGDNDWVLVLETL